MVHATVPIEQNSVVSNEHGVDPLSDDDQDEDENAPNLKRKPVLCDTFRARLKQRKDDYNWLVDEVPIAADL